MWTITFIVLAVASQGAFSLSGMPAVQRQMGDAMIRAMASPERSTVCFPIYAQGIAKANDKYELAYNTCLDNAANSQKLVENEVAPDRASLRSDGEGICATFDKCANMELSTDFFECYLDASGSSLSTSLDMQSVSKTKLQYVNLRYQTIQFDKDFCTDDCTNIYVKESTTLYSQLEECLKTGEVVSPPAPEPTETTTLEPEMTTTAIPTPPQPELFLKFAAIP
uniref:Putative secreted protein n=1 Tax=Haematobia irritans TaxID=7368 RepID=A0A1L8E9R2_HAEIR